MTIDISIQIGITKYIIHIESNWLLYKYTLSPWLVRELWIKTPNRVAV